MDLMNTIFNYWQDYFEPSIDVERADSKALDYVKKILTSEQYNEFESLYLDGTFANEKNGFREGVAFGLRLMSEVITL